jgi:hypothetical protein
VISPAACSEQQHLATSLAAHRLYVVDGGYFQYELFSRILQAESSFVARVSPPMAFDVLEERAIDEAGRWRE